MPKILIQLAASASQEATAAVVKKKISSSRKPAAKKPTAKVPVRGKKPGPGTGKAKKLSPTDIPKRIAELRKIINDSQIELNDLVAQNAQHQSKDIEGQLKALKIKIAKLTKADTMVQFGDRDRGLLKFKIIVKPKSTKTNALAFVALSEKDGGQQIEVWRKVKEHINPGSGRYEKIYYATRLHKVFPLKNTAKSLPSNLERAIKVATSLAGKKMSVVTRKMK